MNKKSAIAAGLLFASMASACTPNFSPRVEDYEPTGQTGTLSLQRTAVSSSGTSYQLTDAGIVLAGPDAELLIDLSKESELDIKLTEGNWEMQLLPGWKLLRSGEEGELVATEGELMSSNPQILAIAPEETRNVSLRFFAYGTGEEVTISDGALEINIVCTEYEDQQSVL